MVAVLSKSTTAVLLFSTLLALVCLLCQFILKDKSFRDFSVTQPWRWLCLMAVEYI